jgi:hypothetical protein
MGRCVRISRLTFPPARRSILKKRLGKDACVVQFLSDRHRCATEPPPGTAARKSMPSNMAATASAVADVDQATVYRKMLFPLPRAFEQCHAGIKTGCGNRPTEWTRLLVQEPMHHHAVQHHHDGISDLRGPACISRLLSCSCPRHRIQHTRLEPLAVDFAHMISWDFIEFDEEIREVSSRNHAFEMRS